MRFKNGRIKIILSFSFSPNLCQTCCNVRHLSTYYNRHLEENVKTIPFILSLPDTYFRRAFFPINYLSTVETSVFLWLCSSLVGNLVKQCLCPVVTSTKQVNIQLSALLVAPAINRHLSNEKLWPCPLNAKAEERHRPFICLVVVVSFYLTIIMRSNWMLLLKDYF